MGFFYPSHSAFSYNQGVCVCVCVYVSFSVAQGSGSWSVRATGNNCRREFAFSFLVAVWPIVSIVS